MYLNAEDERLNKGATTSQELTDSYGGSSNITLENITFDMNQMNSQIGKFIHANNINVRHCKFGNGLYDNHVLEIASIYIATIENCQLNW